MRIQLNIFRAPSSMIQFKLLLTFDTYCGQISKLGNISGTSITIQWGFYGHLITECVAAQGDI